MPPELSERFEILATLGRGGMGVLYLGCDRRLERQVARKLKLPTLREMLHHLESEGKLLAALEHDHVVRLYDYSLTSETPYLVSRMRAPFHKVMPRWATRYRSALGARR